MAKALNKVRPDDLTMAMVRDRLDYNPEEFRSYYGDEGVHWMPEVI